MKKILLTVLSVIAIGEVSSLNGAANNTKEEFYKAILGKPKVDTIYNVYKLDKILGRKPTDQEYKEQMYNHELIAKQLGKDNEKSILAKFKQSPYPTYEDTIKEYKKIEDILSNKEAKEFLSEVDKDETEDLKMLADIIRNAPLNEEQKKTYKDWYNHQLWQQRLDKLALHLWVNRIRKQHKNYPSPKDYQDRLNAIKPKTLKDTLRAFIQDPSKNITIPTHFPKQLLKKHEKYKDAF